MRQGASFLVIFIHTSISMKDANLPVEATAYL
jgi:hypothetical protein